MFTRDIPEDTLVSLEKNTSGETYSGLETNGNMLVRGARGGDTQQINPRADLYDLAGAGATKITLRAPAHYQFSNPRQK